MFRHECCMRVRDCHVRYGEWYESKNQHVEFKLYSISVIFQYVLNSTKIMKLNNNRLNTFDIKVINFETYGN